MRAWIEEREEAALNLDHDPVPCLEGVQNILQGQLDLSGFIGDEGLRLLPGVPEAASDDLRSNHHLISAHGDPPGEACMVRGVGGEHVHQLHDPIRVRTGGGHPEVGQ